MTGSDIVVVRGTERSNHWLVTTAIRESNLSMILKAYDWSRQKRVLGLVAQML